jgi:hypothetical protein
MLSQGSPFNRHPPLNPTVHSRRSSRLILSVLQLLQLNAVEDHAK